MIHSWYNTLLYQTEWHYKIQLCDNDDERQNSSIYDEKSTIPVTNEMNKTRYRTEQRTLIIVYFFIVWIFENKQ